ncbi:arsenite methyltransferase-like [Physella acuta]|uniref:arsenite methyltransferase-like n=1 Tax=Physella acuta TaxID=109671 RepID=UPI0027DD890F|nr:arsenite methyltransferase-like [Physella acuta]
MGEERSRLIIRQMYRSMKETMYDARLNVEALPSHARKLLPQISERTFRSYDGTAMFIPDVIHGARVLDIGCGGGSLTFLLSKLVGPSGHVVGVDSSEQFIQLCQEQTDYHMREWGYTQPNCEFIQTDIETLTDFQLEPFDVIV